MQAALGSAVGPDWSITRDVWDSGTQVKGPGNLGGPMKLQAPGLRPVRVWVSNRSWINLGHSLRALLIEGRQGWRGGGGEVCAVAFHVSVSVTG